MVKSVEEEKKWLMEMEESSEKDMNKLKKKYGLKDFSTKEIVKRHLELKKENNILKKKIKNKEQEIK